MRADRDLQAVGGCVCLLLVLAWWGFVAWAVLHFVLKYW
jgi:hypothetical protein